MELDRERARSIVMMQRIIVISIMSLAVILVGVILMNGGYLFKGPGSLQLSAILFVSLIMIMVLVSIPSLFIKSRPSDDDEEVLVWDEDEIYEEFTSVDMVQSGCLR